MRLSSYLIPALVFAVAAGISLLTASFAVTGIERSTEIGLRQALDEDDLGWAEVQANGLTVILAGTAPSEALRFRAVATAGTVVDAARVIDRMEVRAAEALAAPRFSAEILRNDSGISIIGLIPQRMDREGMLERLNAISPNVADLLETADYPVPPGWTDAMGFAVTALELLARSKVSVDAGRIRITAIADSAEAKADLERRLNRAKPPGLQMTLNIAAPRPVITPFTLRFVIDEQGPRFDACSANDEAARETILAAAAEAGLSGAPRCVIGMGVPSPDWAEAAAVSIAALDELGAGTVTFSDADVALVAAQGTDPAVFDRVIGELEASLPDVFSLHAVLPEPETERAEGPPEFTATLSPEGQVQLRGRLNSENLRAVADSFAKSRFGSDRVYTATRVVDGLPSDWPVRVLAGLEALSMLENGALVVTPDDVSVQGITEDPDARADMAALLADKLGEANTYRIDVTYREPPPPTDEPLDPEQCEAAIGNILAGGKITFEPGSARIDAASAQIMDEIAEVLKNCGNVELEIQGHTDSQGREVMKQELSQERAQAVLEGLRARRIITSNFTVRGYGEERPIADNSTEEGREANRRIEFRLIPREDVPVTRETTLDAIAQEPDAPAGEAGSDDAPDEGSGDGESGPEPDTDPAEGQDQ